MKAMTPTTPSRQHLLCPHRILIPPSVPVSFTLITAGGVSVAALFMGGYLPGILMGLCVAGLAVFIHRRQEGL